MFRLWRRPTADEVVEDMRRVVPNALGDRLLSLILHGMHADADSGVAVSIAEPVNLLFVLRALNQPALNDLSKVLRQVQGSARLTPMVLSVEELLTSTDVFPITFLEMQRRYRVLAGEDVLAELPISDVHLRLRCEQELKNLVLRMQSAFLLQSHRPRRLHASLRTSYAAFLRAARASLVLVDGGAPRAEADIITLGSAKLDLDQAVLLRVADACRGEAAMGRDAIADAYGAFLVVVHQAAKAVDELSDDVVVVDAH